MTPQPGNGAHMKRIHLNRGRMNCSVIHLCHVHRQLFPTVHVAHCQEVTANLKETMKVCALAPLKDRMAQATCSQALA